MDSDATGAVTAAVHDTKHELDRWFELIKEQYDALEPDEDWEEFKPRFKAAAEAEQYAPEKVDYFLEYVGGLSDPFGVVGQLADENEWSNALSVYQESYPLADGAVTDAAVDGQATGDAAGEDETAFYAYLRSEWNGRWDGREESWAEYADWVVYSAGQAGYPTLAKGWRDYCEGAGDKVAALAEYELSVSGATAPAAAAPAADTATQATSEATTDEDDTDLGAAFAELFDDHAIAAAESTAAKAAEHLVSAGEVPSDLGDQLPAAFRDVLAEIPQAAALTEQEIRALFTELARETA